MLDSRVTMTVLPPSETWLSPPPPAGWSTPPSCCVALVEQRVLGRSFIQRPHLCSVVGMASGLRTSENSHAALGKRSWRSGGGLRDPSFPLL